MKEKNIFQKILVSMVAFAMVAVMLAPLTVEAAPYYSEKEVYYLNSKTGSSYGSVYIGNISKGQKILSVSSSNKKVVKPTGYSNYTNTQSYKNLVDKDGNSSYNSRYGYGELKLLKPGKATVSVKVGKSTSSCKTYKTQVTVKKYENPIKSLKITGISSGKNIYKKFNNQSYNSGTISKNIKSAKVSVTANKDNGWRIQSISFYNYKNDCRRNIYYGGNGSTSGSLSLSTIYASNGGYVDVYFYNVKTGGYMDCTYVISPK